MITILRNRYTKGSARERLPQDAVEYGLSLQGVLGYDSLCQGGEGDKTGAGAAALETSSGHAQMELQAKCHHVPISFVPPRPDQSVVIWTENPHPSPEAAMSKVIAKPRAAEPSSPPSEVVDRSTRSPTNSMSASPWFIIGSSTPDANGSIEWTGTIAPALQGRPHGPRPPSRIWS